MKKIKIAYSGRWPGIDREKWPVYKILSERYDVEIAEDADYVFCNCFGDDPVNYSFYEYVKCPQVRIMWSGENYIPDFNLVDYGISQYPLELGDRHFCFPCLTDVNDGLFPPPHKERNFDAQSLKDKVYFANFIAGHESEFSIRGDFFKKLCEYKRVESPGRYLNNMEGGKTILYQEKRDFQKKCKFTLCFESTKQYGFLTEKILDAFLTDTIPVYYGSDTVKDVFNPKAFINVSDFDSFDDAIAKIIELDQDDEAYLKMLNEPMLNDENYFDNKMEELRAFLYNIFDQPLEKAYRRSRVYRPQYYETYLASLRNLESEITDRSYFDKHFSGKEMRAFLRKKLLKRLHLRK